METDKIICASWIGRFGNRCHSYLYGKHIEQKFGQKFYIPTEWEGSVLFENAPPCVDEEFRNLNFIYAGGAWRTDKFKSNKDKIDQYNINYSDNIEFIDPVRKTDYGKVNTAYISLVTDCNWFYENVKLSEIRTYFKFTEEVKNTDLYKRLEDAQGTYDVAHFKAQTLHVKIM